MISIKNKEDCCGCNACGDACGKGAIEFVSDNEGFWYPSVDEAKCVGCGLCERVCPIINLDKVKGHGQHEPEIYGGYHKNITIRFDSTSGGIFSALANSMYRDSGYVAGAVFNDDFTVSNFVSNSKKDLPRLRGSKYVQSSAIGIYRQIKDLLESGEKVLACGSPCQMAALRTFLGTDYENLIIVDFLCRATNSPKAYRKYLDYLEKRFDSKIVYIKAKNKDHGWRSLARKVVFENGQVYYGEGHDDPYRRGYHRDLFERPSCYRCRFKDLPRCSDITLGDFWGIERVDPDLDRNLGTSLIMLNTEKGRNYFKRIQSKLEVKPFLLKDIVPGNSPAIYDGAKYPAMDREKFFEDMDMLPFEELAQKYFPEEPKGRSLKETVRNMLRFGYQAAKSPADFLRIVKYNWLRKNTESKVFENSYIKVLSHCALDLHRSARIVISNGVFTFGLKRNRKSKMETRLLLEEGATLQVDGVNFIKNGSDIQVFRNGTLRLGTGATNQGLQIVCAEKIWIGDNTRIGRDVWIRDNNGGHSVIQVGYSDRAPVIIGDNVWICSNVSIMKGVTIGEGSIISANSVVTTNIPPHCIASGNPAKVVAENIIWRP